MCLRWVRGAVCRWEYIFLCNLYVLFVWLVYINCAIYIHIIIYIGYARAHDVGAAHSDCEASRLRMHIKNIAIFDEIGILAQFR